jgi:hypothetical protein
MKKCIYAKRDVRNVGVNNIAQADGNLTPCRSYFCALKHKCYIIEEIPAEMRSNKVFDTTILQ